MDKHVLVAIAKAVLSSCIGPGTWEEHGDKRKDMYPIDSMKGLAIGDTVWMYCEDSEELLEQAVVAIKKGVAFVVLDSSIYTVPALIPVTDSMHRRTRLDAIALWHKSIVSDIEYMDRRDGPLRELKQLLAKD